MKYRIKEIFGPTIEGEGSLAGTVTKFIRFSGCNKWTGREEDRAASICSFCDTDFRDGKFYTISEVLAELNALGPVRNVVLTGGEPLLQLDNNFLSYLVNAHYKLFLETNGSRPLGGLKAFFDHITVSPKQPYEDCEIEEADDLKLLYPYLERITPETFDRFRAKKRYLQPIEEDWRKSKGYHTTNVIKELYRLRGKYKLSLQIHKILGVP